LRLVIAAISGIAPTRAIIPAWPNLVAIERSVRKHT
jgi:hypothetical protein